MSRQGGFILDNHTNREKLAYEDLMNCHSDEVTIDGKTFNYPPHESRNVSNDDDYKTMNDK